MNTRRTRLRSALAAISTVLVLVPTAFLFDRVWQDNSDRHGSSALEQHGVEYLAALSPLVSALVEDQSSALQGVTKPIPSLTAAIVQVARVDARLGGSLQTTLRWNGLRANIAKLPSFSGGPLTIFAAHAEAADLTLALYQAVRRNSGLNRDPDNDLASLQQAVAVDMPETVVAVSRMGDLAAITAKAVGTAKTAVAAQFGQQVVEVQSLVDRLTDDLQAAVDDTASTTLSGSLVSALDSFRRSVESMNSGVNVGGPPNVAATATAQSALQTALAGLAGITLKEMAGLLDSRMTTLQNRRNEILSAGALVLFLVLAALIWPMAGRRRQFVRVVAPVGETTRDIALGQPAGFGNDPYDQRPTFGGNPTRREQSGALR